MSLNVFYALDDIERLCRSRELNLSEILRACVLPAIHQTPDYCDRS